MASKSLTITLTGNAASLNRAFRASEEAAARFGADIQKTNTKVAASGRRLGTDTDHVHTRMRKSWHGVTTSARGYAVALVGVAGVIEGAKKSIEVAGQQGAATAALSTTVKAAGLQWRAHSKELDGYVESARRAKGFTDVALTKTLTGFIRTTKDTAAAQHLTNVAMDVARAKGTDLEGVQSALSKVWLGSFRALKTYGVQFTPTTRAQDALRASTQHASAAQRDHAKQLDLAANRTTALGLVQKAYAGQAAKYADTSQGKLARFHSAIDAVEAKLGTALMPALTGVAEEGVKVAESLERHWPQIKKDIGDVVQPIKDVGGAVVDFAKANPGLAKAAGSIGLMAIAVNKINKHTGVISLLGKLGKGALSGGASALGGGAVASKALGKASPVPVFVTNPGGIGGGGVPSTVGGVAGKGSKVLGALKTVGKVALPIGLAVAITEMDDSGGKLAGPIKKIQQIDAWLKKTRASSTGAAAGLAIYGRQVEDAGDKIAHWSRKSVLGLDTIEQTTRSKSKKIAQLLDVNSAAGQRALSANFAGAVRAIERSMAAGVTTTDAGTAAINRILTKELAALGGGAGGGAAGAMIGLIAGKKAGGGWINQAGQRGRDNRLILAGDGEAVVNGPQQPFVQTGLAVSKALGIQPYGSLDELFAHEDRPHHMAQGGIVAPRISGRGPISTIGQRVLSKEARAANALLRRLGGGAKLDRMFAFADRLGAMGIPYGPQGHSGWPINRAGEDCSSTVSKVIHPGGFLSSVLDTTALPGALEPGRGRYVTVYDRPLPGDAGHTIVGLKRGGRERFFGTSRTHKGGGPGWIDAGAATASIANLKTHLHPKGMAQGGFVSTSYGPPWGGINGGGTTATGVNLSKAPHMYGVAVDPSVIPLGSMLRVTPNPFGYDGAFKAFDTGGAIKGNRLDFYDWRGREKQLGWGRRNVTVTMAGAKAAATSSRRKAGAAPPRKAKGARERLVSPDLGFGDATALGLAQADVASATASARGDAAGVTRASYQRLSIDRAIVGHDLAALKKVNAALGKPRSAKSRAALIAQRLSLLQELAATQGDISSIQADLTTTAGGGGATGDDPAESSAQAAADLVAAMKDLKASIDADAQFRASVEGVTSSQAIRALADVISGQIAGQYFSRATGSAGDGSVARYGSVGRS